MMDPTIYLSVFGVALVTAVFWGGYKLGAIETRVKVHEQLIVHEGARALFVPRAEIDNRLKGMANDIKEIKNDVRIIKNGKS